MDLARRTLVTIPVLVALVAAASAVSASAAEPQRPRDVMAKAIETLGAHAQNAKVKVRTGSRGFGLGGSSSAASQGEDLSRGGRIGRANGPENEPLSAKPSSCCGRNLQVMDEQVRTIQAVLVEYHRRLGGDDKATESVADMTRHLKELVAALAVFRKTDSADAARSSIGAAIAALAELSEAHAAFLDCCAPKAGWNQQT